MTRKRSPKRGGGRPRLTKAQRQHLRVAAGLKYLPPRLKSDVLAASGGLPGVTISNVVRIGETNVQRAALFEAMRRSLATGQPVTLPVGRKSASLSIGTDGATEIHLERTVYRIEGGDAAAEDAPVRQLAVERILSRSLLSAEMTSSWRQTAEARAFREDEFFQLHEVAAVSPGHYLSTVSQRLEAGELRHEDLLFPDDRYWDLLLPDAAGCQTLDDYLAGPFDDEFRARFKNDPKPAFAALSRHFGARALVRHTLVAELPEDVRLEVMRQARESSNPYAIVSTIELCAREEGASFAELGAELLNDLRSNLESVEATLNVVSSVIVATLPTLAAHGRLGQKPSYWRRVAASAHAATVAEGFGKGLLGDDSLLTWSYGTFGERFILTVADDAALHPRWIADWVSPEHLLADLVGRLKPLADKAPESWKEALEALLQVVTSRELDIEATLPSFLEGHLPLPVVPDGDLSDLNEPLERARNDPSYEAVLVFRPMTYAFGLVPALPDLIRARVERILAEAPPLDEPQVLTCLKFATQVALMVRDAPLATATISAILSVATTQLPPGNRLFELVGLLVVCSRALDAEAQTVQITRAIAILVSTFTDRVNLRQLGRAIAALREVSSALNGPLAAVSAQIALGAGQ